MKEYYEWKYGVPFQINESNYMQYHYGQNVIEGTSLDDCDKYLTKLLELKYGEGNLIILNQHEYKMPKPVRLPPVSKSQRLLKDKLITYDYNLRIIADLLDIPIPDDEKVDIDRIVDCLYGFIVRRKAVGTFLDSKKILTDFTPIYRLLGIKPNDTFKNKEMPMSKDTQELPENFPQGNQTQ